MATLVTGASGFVGRVLIQRLLEKGERIYGLSRHPPSAVKNLIPLPGDITKPNLALEYVPKDISAVQHLAGIHYLGEDKDGSIWRTNVDGTRNVIDFCFKYNIPHLFFTSTAYTQGMNTYERSKSLCEAMVNKSSIPRVTIFKPSVIMGTEEHPYPGHFSQVVLMIIKVHQRAELIRRKIEGALQLPIIEPVFRLKGKPEGKLNLIQVDQVAWAMANIKDTGTFWLTNPNPSTLQELLNWIGEFIMVRIKILPDFEPNLIEAQFAKMADAFAPYLQGDNFPSDLKDHSPITKKFIEQTIRRTLLSKS